MRYLALACDYDGTIAHNGRVDELTRAALEKVKASGRKLILVTGRQLDDLESVCPNLQLFDLLVVENGAVVFDPVTKKKTILAPGPPPEFAERLRARGVPDVATGDVIVATWEPHEHTVLEAIHEMGLELQVIFNKGAVMVLPSGTNKASGLTAVLDDLGLSFHNTVGVGDAENDHAFLGLCEFSAAVSNALPVLKERVDFVTESDHGTGITELIEQILESDLAELSPPRHKIPIGEEVAIDAFGENILITGSSGSGKSTFATSFMETLADRRYQFCIIDPEGDYENFLHCVKKGDRDHPPDIAETLKVLENPAHNVVLSFLGIKIDQRPAFFESFFPQLQELRARTGHPHWVVVDEAHHLINRPAPALPREFQGLLMITVHPDNLALDVLRAVDLIVTVGRDAAATVRLVAQKLGKAAPVVPNLAGAEAFGWRPASNETSRFKAIPPKTERTRHLRKYATGELIDEENFHFRGPDGRLDLKANNLQTFIRMAEGVDDETWRYHLARHEYSNWFENVIKDPALAQEAREIEDKRPPESRKKIKEAIEHRYSA